MFSYKHKTLEMDLDLLGSTREKYNEPSYALQLEDQIHRVLFSPFEYSQEVLLIGMQNKILIGTLSVEDNFEFKRMCEYEHNPRCTALAFSPKTCLSIRPSCVHFCSAGNDFQIRVFKTDLTSTTCKVLKGHTGYINDVSYDPETFHLASVSDDQTAKLWNFTKCVFTFLLTSPGINVSWHKEDVAKLMVAEKVGLIRFYNIETRKPIMSVDYHRLLSAATWAPSDTQLIASLQQGELLLWDLANPSQPTQTKLLFAESAGSVQFNESGELIGAVNPLTSTLKIVHLPSLQQRLQAHVILPSNLSWHFRFPIVSVGSNRKLCFWKVSSK